MTTFISAVGLTPNTFNQTTTDSVTVPSDATAAYVFWSWYNGSYTGDIVSATLGGNAFDQKQSLGTVGGTLTGVGVAAFYSPPVGAQNLVINWGAATQSQGPSVHVAFTKNGNLTSWAAAGALQEAGQTTARTFDLASATDSVVLKHDNDYQGTPGTGTGWTSRATSDNSNRLSRLSTKDSPGSSLTTVTTEATINYPTLAGVSIPTAAGVSITPPIQRFWRNP